MTDTSAFTLDGHRVFRVAPGCLLRDDMMVGRCDGKWGSGRRVTQAIWYALPELAARAGLSEQTLRARLKDRWSFSDLLRPQGWERAVHAKRHGVDVGDGKREPVADVAKRLGCTVETLLRRIGAGWHLADVLSPGQSRRKVLPKGTAEVPADAVTWDMLAHASRAGSDGVPNARRHARFAYAGALDTLAGHCRTMGISYDIVRYRMRTGLTFEEACAPGRKARSDRGRPNPNRGRKRRLPPVPVQDMFPPAA